ncbi:MAG: discoidin domain-containing protein [Phycisphaerae bacterium]|jgi:hypothetical protein|nr:discoidin domain-containing protein [Phycisphaerae bacterium]
MLSRILPVIAVAMVLAMVAPIHAAPVPVNVALYADVTASGATTGSALASPGEIVDGNYNTSHQFYGTKNGTKNTGWWLIDLGAAYTVDHAYHRAYDSRYTITEYSILGKLNEGDDFTNLITVLGNNSFEDDAYFPATEVRYVKFDVLDCEYSAPALREFELYTPEPTTMSLLALGGLALLRRRRTARSC